MATSNKDKATGGSTTGGAPVQVMVDADTLAKYGAQINDYDVRIAAASGSDGAAKKAFIEGLVVKNAERVNNTVDSLIEQLSSQDMELLVGLVAQLETRLKADLAPKVDAYVDAEFPKTQTDSKEDVERLKETRKELLVQFKALREVLTTFGIKHDHVPDPKRSGGGRPAGSTTGSGTKTGANKEGYRYLIDGKERPRSQNSFSSVAFYSTVGIPAHILKETESFQALSDEAKAAAIKAARPRWTAGELKTFLEKAGVAFGTQDEWVVTLPTGKKVGARRMTDQDKVELGIVDDANDLDNETGDVAAEITEGTMAESAV